MKRVADVLDALVERGAVAGGVVVVAGPSETRLAHAVGHADVETGTPFSRDTIVRVHSMSKPVMVAAVLSLVEAGLVALDDDVARYLPELAALRFRDDEGEHAITIAHLLTHTSGLVYPNRGGTDAERSLADALGDMHATEIPLAEWTRRLGRASLRHRPGDAYAYGVSIDVLGRVAEVVSGAPLDVFLRETLFAPLGMIDTGFGVPVAARARVATLYRGTPRGLERFAARADVPAFLSAGGGLFSTARDYLRFARMLLGGGALEGVRVLAEASVRAMHDTTTFPSARRADAETLRPGCTFGLGVRVVVDPELAGYGSVGTFGWDGIGGTTFFVDPVEDVVGLFVAQVFPWPDGMHARFRAAVYDAIG